MDSETLKRNIRRRLFAAEFKPGDPHRSSSEHFVACPNCEGTGKVCRADFANSMPVAEELSVCTMCEGAEFIARETA